MPRKAIGEIGYDRCRTPGPLSRRARGRRTGDPHPPPGSIIAAAPGAGTITSPASCKHRLSTPPGWTACRTAFRTVRPPKHCARSAIWTSANFRRSSRRAASAETDPSLPHHPGGLRRWVHRNPPRAAASAFLRGTPRRAGPPYGLPAQATTRGGQFWTPMGGQYSTPIDSLAAAAHGARQSAQSSWKHCDEYGDDAPTDQPEEKASLRKSGGYHR